MDLAQLFNPVEKIVGMEIAHGRVCAVLLEKDKKGVVNGTKREAVIPPGIVAENGTVLDKQKLAAALKTIWRSGKDVFKSKYVIVALPPSPVFTDIVKFPKVSSEQLKEAMQLYVKTKTSFPVDTNEIYYDWQPLGAHNVYHEDVLVSFAKRPYIHDFVEACEEAGLEPLAFETPHPATARALVNFENKTGLIVRVAQECVEFSVASKNDLFFARSVPLPASYDFETLKTICATEAAHALNYYATEFSMEAPVAAAVLLAHVPQKKELADHLRETLGIAIEDARFAYATAIGDSCAAAFGAALRGLIRREEDTLISLLPIGTEEAYRKRRFLAYVSLWTDIVNTTAVLFVILFGATLLFLNIVGKSALAQSARLKATTAQSDQVTMLEKEAARFNAAVSAVAQAHDSIVVFSPIIERMLPSLRYDGILIKTAAIAPSGTDLRVSIVAATRDNAIAFRKSLENDPLYAKVAVPPLGATQRLSIPLDIALSLAEQRP